MFCVYRHKTHEVVSRRFATESRSAMPRESQEPTSSAHWVRIGPYCLTRADLARSTSDCFQTVPTDLLTRSSHPRNWIASETQEAPNASNGSQSATDAL